jgi:ribosome assembly protein 1
VLLGPSISPAESVPAGNIVGIIGLEDYILKTATISDSWVCPPLKAITFQSKPMLKVAVEPENPMNLRALEAGLQSLNQFDPVVEVGIDSNGQRTMTCLGELHLDQCVKALVEKFAKCRLKVSEPLVAFREGIVLDDTTYPVTPTQVPHPAFVSLPSSQQSGSALSAAEAAVQAHCSPAELLAAGMEASNGNTDNNGLKLPPPWCDLTGITRARQGYVRYSVEAKNIAVTVQAVPMPIAAVNHLEQDSTGLTALDEVLYHSFLDANTIEATECPSARIFEEFLHKHRSVDKAWQAFANELNTKLADQATSSSSSPYFASSLTSLSSRLISIGPRHCPTNFLSFHPQAQIEIVDNRGLYLPHTYLNKLASSSASVEEIEHGFWGQKLAQINATNPVFYRLWQRLHTSIVAGFQEAVGAGPLMHEPMHAVCFQVNKIEFTASVVESILGKEEFEQLLLSSASMMDNSFVNNMSTSVVIHTGQLISETKDNLRLALLSCPSRIIEPIFSCNLQCDQAQLGNLYAVLSRRRGTVYQEDIIEGTNLFVLSAYLPVANSFHFAQELLKKTSGSGTAPQLSFSHWEAMASDPFWRPRTEEELEEFGEDYFDEHNQARSCITAVRKRKGLAVDEQVVVSAEKQRTLKR